MHPELAEAGRIAIHELIDAELLDEPLEFPERHFAFSEIDEVDADASFGEKPLCLSRICALPEAKDLNFHEGVSAARRVGARARV